MVIEIPKEFYSIKPNIKGLKAVWGKSGELLGIMNEESTNLV